VVQLIEDAFSLNHIPTDGNKPFHISRHRRLLIKRNCHGRRSLSAPPMLEAMRAKLPNSNLLDKATSEDYYRKVLIPRDNNNNRRKPSPEPTIRQSIPRPMEMNNRGRNQNQNQRKIAFNLQNHDRGNTTSVKGIFPSTRPSSVVHRSRSYSPPRNRGHPPPSSYSQHHQRKMEPPLSPSTSLSYLNASNLSISFKPQSKSTPGSAQKNANKPMSEKVMKVSSVRQMEMMRERLQAQQRDRTIRRRSFLTKYEEDEEIARRRRMMNLKLNNNNSNNNYNPPGSPSSKDSNSVDSLFPIAQQQKGNKNKPARMTDITDSKNLRQSYNSSDGPAAAPTNVNAVIRPSSSSSSFPGSHLRSREDWQPPRIDLIEVEKARKTIVPLITTAQQTAVRDWLLSLGISVMDGEGGYYHNQDPRVQGHSNLSGVHATTTVSGSASSTVIRNSLAPLPLHRDRLRNGETFCILFCYLEPSSAYHANLFAVIHRSPKTLQRAFENLEKAFWLLRLRRSPPIPLVYLIQPEEFLKCNVNMIWGLLWEIYQCYSSSASGGAEHGPYNSALSFGNLKEHPVNFQYYRNQTNKGAGVGSSLTSLSYNEQQQPSNQLPYNQIQRRSLDISLMEWLDNCGLLKLVLGTSTMITRPPTVLALETYIKDGTLLCYLTESILSLPLKGSFYHHPHTYSQCLSNLMKCLTILRSCKCMPRRFLYSGVEEEIARGSWDVILGLLEDIHLFYDLVNDYMVFPHRRNSSLLFSEEDISTETGGVQVQSIPMTIPLERIDRPYLGPISMMKRRPTQTSSLTSSSARSSFMNNNPAVGGEKNYGPPFVDTMATTVRMSQPQQQQHQFHPSSSSFLPGPTTSASLPEFSLRKNYVRLDRQYPSSGADYYEEEDRGWNEDKPVAQNNNIRTNFRPSLDLKGSFQSRLSGDDNDGDEDDVSFLFSPGQEEKRKNQALPIQSVGEFQHELFRQSNDSARTNMPSIHDMTAVDPAMTMVTRQQRQHDNLRNNNNTENFKQGASDQPENMIPQPLSGVASATSNAPTSASSTPSSSILSQLKTVIHWLDDLGMKIPFQKEHFLSSDPSANDSMDVEQLILSPKLLSDFGVLLSDGVILGKLAMKLSYQEIPALELKPKTSAQRLNNIRKSLELLAMNNKKIPLRVLSCEEEILQGDSVTILQLLEHMKKAYYFVVK
jgi:hypothetical protein